MEPGEEFLRFDGRIGRAAYVRALVALGLILSVPFSIPALYEPRLSIISYNFGAELAGAARALVGALSRAQDFAWILALVGSLVLLSLTVRRLNDAGKPAWLVLAAPVALIIALVADSDGPNDFGSGPGRSLPRLLAGGALLVLLLVGFALLIGVTMHADPSIGAPQ